MTHKQLEPTTPQSCTKPLLSAKTVLTTHEVASLIQVNNSSVNYWTEKKGLKCYRTPGNHRRITVADLAEFLTAWQMPIPFVIREM